MWRVLVPLALCLSAAASQPVVCQSNEQCHEGYCDVATGACKKCLFCKDYNREPPSTPVACITTVSQCGVCIKGLEEPVSGNVQEPCAAGGGAPAYVWLAVGGLALSAALIATVYYVLRKKHVNIFSSTSTAVLAPRVEAPSAPEAPPPYTPEYSPLRTESPAPAPFEDSERPFLKRAPAPAAPREAAGRQAAYVFNKPSYDRGPHQPNKYPSEAEPPAAPEPDEDTVESPWTPDGAANNNAQGESSSSSSSASGGGGGGGGEPGASALPAALAAARGTVLLRPPADAAPPAKLPRLPQDTNNNASSHREREEPSGAPSINILVNVQQISDVKL